MSTHKFCGGKCPQYPLVLPPMVHCNCYYNINRQGLNMSGLLAKVLYKNFSNSVTAKAFNAQFVHQLHHLIDK